MISPLVNRQGFDTGLSGVTGTSIQSAYTKPNIEAERGLFNFSWLPYPYGPLPDVGPWANGDPNEKDESATPETPSEAQPWKSETPATMMTGGMLFMVVVAGAFLLTKYVR